MILNTLFPTIMIHLKHVLGLTFISILSKSHHTLLFIIFVCTFFLQQYYQKGNSPQTAGEVSIPRINRPHVQPGTQPFYQFAISTSPIIHFLGVFLAPPPQTHKQFCISIVFIFFRDFQSSQENVNDAYAKLLACVGVKKHANKMYFGRCGNGEYQ